MVLVYIIRFSLIFGFTFAHAVVANLNCPEFFDEEPVAVSSQQQALITLHRRLPEIAGPEIKDHPSYQLLGNFALPSAARRRNRNVVAVTVGGANVGKSTVVNALPSLIRGDPEYMINRPVTKAGFDAGLTKKMVAVYSGRDPDGSLMRDLTERYGELVPWTSAEDSVQDAGPGVFVAQPELSDNVVVIDGSDFDSGLPHLSQPQNLERAKRVICPADVLIGVFTIQNALSHGNLTLLRNIFRYYGSKKMILILQAPETYRASAVNSLLIQLANTLYETSGNQYPPGVLAAYLMPSEPEVHEEERYPRLIPLEREFLPIQKLIPYLSENAVEIKRFAFDNALKTIKNDVQNLVRDALKQQLAMGLYQHAVKALIESAASDSIQDFPYEAQRDTIRSRFRYYRSKLAQRTYKFEVLIGNTEQLYHWAKREIPGLRKLTPLLSESERKPLQESHRTHDKAAVAQLIIQLQQRVLVFERPKMSSAAETLEKLTGAYFRLFPEEKTAEDEVDDLEFDEAVVKGAKVRVRLPRTSLLLPSSQKALRNLLSQDREVLEEQLSKELNDRQFSTSPLPESDEDLARVLEALKENRWQRYRSNLLSVGTLSLPFVAAGLVHWVGLDFMLLDLAAFIGTARGMYAWNDKVTDQFLETRLNEWFHKLQYGVTALFFEEKTRPLIGALASESTQHEDTLRQIQQALEQLDPSYKPLPMSLGELR